MEPLFFFFFEEPSYKEIKLKLTFEGLKGKNTSIAEFNEFMMCLEEIHNRVVISTQPEYHLDKRMNMTNNTVILDCHKLHIEHLCRKNPFEIVLTFHILKNGIAPYWTLMKILVAMCERYGKNTNDLLATIEKFKSEFNRLYDKYHSNVPYLEELDPFKNKDKLFDKIRFSTKKLLTNRDFSLYFNAICKTTITITNFISQIEDKTDEVISFIEGDK